MQLPFARPVTLIKQLGEPGESRRTVMCSVQERRGYFEASAPVNPGDVVEVIRPGGGGQHLVVARVRTRAPAPGLEHLEAAWRPAPPVQRARAQRLCLKKLHPAVAKVAAAPLSEGNHLEAITSVQAVLGARVRSLAKLDLRGEALMAHAFDEEAPAPLLAVQGPHAAAERRRLKLLMMGAMVTPGQAGDAQSALEQLGLLSFLLRQLDRLELASGAQPDPAV